VINGAWDAPYTYLLIKVRGTHPTLAEKYASLDFIRLCLFTLFFSNHL